MGSPIALVTGDFNGDGRTDLAVANYDDNDVSILLGKGDGTFAAPGQFATTPPPRRWWPTSTVTAPTMCWSSTAPARFSIARAFPRSPAP